MKIRQEGAFLVGSLEGAKLGEKDRQTLLAMGNEDLEDEIMEMMDEADAVAAPCALFGVCPVGENGTVNGVDTHSSLVAEKLAGKGRCFPYIVTCGKELEAWSKKYASDFLLGFWADEIKKKFLLQGFLAFKEHLKECYHISGHMAVLNPGSLESWPISGQAELFAMLGGREFVEQTVGVTYSDTFLMFPAKSMSGISFESEVFYENCQHCPLTDCPGRRAKQIKE